MAEEKEQDPFALMINFCRPTVSQEAKFLKCRMDRESEFDPDPNQDELSSSSELTSPQPTEIVMVSPASSASSSQHQAEEDDMVFHTPPEHHNRSSSEEPNLDELCARDMRNYEVGDVCHRSEKARVSEVQLDDEADSETIRVQSEGFDGDTVPVGETEEIVIGTQADKEVMVVDSVYSGKIRDEFGINDLGQKSSELMKDCAPTTTVENPRENSYSTGNLNSSKIEEEIVKLKCKSGNRRSEMTHETEVGESEKCVEITKDEETSKDNGCLRSNGKRIREIDEVRCVSVGDVQTRCKKRQLPLSLDGKEKNVKEGRNGCHRSKRARVSEVELDDEADSEKIRVCSEGFDGETVPVGETEEIVVETQASIGVVHSAAKVIVVDSVDSGENINDLGQENSEMTKYCAPAATVENPCENSYSTRSLNSSKIEQEIVKVKCTVGNGCSEKTTHEIGVGGSEKSVKSTRDEKTSKDNGGLKSNGKRIREIDEFRYVSLRDVQRSCKKRQLPSSLDGTEKSVEEGRNMSEKNKRMESKGGLLDRLDVAKVFAVGDKDDGAGEDVDFLETVKRRGLTFPRPRWWGP